MNKLSWRVVCAGVVLAGCEGIAIVGVRPPIDPSITGPGCRPLVERNVSVTPFDPSIRLDESGDCDGDGIRNAVDACRGVGGESCADVETDCAAFIADPVAASARSLDLRGCVARIQPTSDIQIRGNLRCASISSTSEHTLHLERASVVRTTIRHTGRVALGPQTIAESSIVAGSVDARNSTITLSFLAMQQRLSDWRDTRVTWSEIHLATRVRFQAVRSAFEGSLVRVDREVDGVGNNTDGPISDTSAWLDFRTVTIGNSRVSGNADWLNVQVLRSHIALGNGTVSSSSFEKSHLRSDEHTVLFGTELVDAVLFGPTTTTPVDTTAPSTELRMINGHSERTQIVSGRVYLQGTPTHDMSVQSAAEIRAVFSGISDSTFCAGARVALVASSLGTSRCEALRVDSCAQNSSAVGGCQIEALPQMCPPMFAERAPTGDVANVP